MVELRNTATLMCSNNYKDRFAAEYLQLQTRFLKLKSMCEKWDKDELEFTPTCPRSCYDLQLSAMQDYLAVLEMRAKVEQVDLKWYVENY